MKFTWQVSKNKLNQLKHDVSFEEAQSVIQSGDYASLLDSSSDEERFKAIGLSLKSRVLLVVYCYRFENLIRIISARKATKKEVKIWQSLKK